MSMDHRLHIGATFIYAHMQTQLAEGLAATGDALTTAIHDQEAVRTDFSLRSGRGCTQEAAIGNAGAEVSVVVCNPASGMQTLTVVDQLGA
jgi:hypothetical protein